MSPTSTTSQAEEAGRRVTVHEATATGLARLRDYFRELWERRSFVWHLARTDLKGDNYGTFLGQVWLILDPLLMATVYVFVRTVILPVGGEDRSDVVSHLVTGVFFFQYVAGCLNRGSRSVTANKGLVLNTPFPRLIFPAVSVLNSLLSFLPGTLVVLAA
ncbi:MAG: hypothetical protein U5R31_04060 [Acidimicrobiia bacterium]|nr:hypothetical protein [Acidimicrobiia bacterium]